MILKFGLTFTVLVSAATAGRVKRMSISCPPNKYGNNCEFTRCAANPCPPSKICIDADTWDNDHICDEIMPIEPEEFLCPKGSYGNVPFCYPCDEIADDIYAPECDAYWEDEANDSQPDVDNNDDKNENDEDSDQGQLFEVDYAKIEKKSDRALQGVRDLRQGRLQIKLKQKIEKIAARVAHEEVLAALKAANLN